MSKREEIHTEHGPLALVLLPTVVERTPRLPWWEAFYRGRSVGWIVADDREGERRFFAIMRGPKIRGEADPVYPKREDAATYIAGVARARAGR